MKSLPTFLSVVPSNITIQITTSGSPILGQNGYTLTCSVPQFGIENLNPSITYVWIKDNGTETQIQNGSDPISISFAPLRVSDVGHYACQANISSPYLNGALILSGSQNITVLSEFVVISACCVCQTESGWL